MFFIKKLRKLILKASQKIRNVFIGLIKESDPLQFLNVPLYIYAFV
jgi:hypothetical protein